jgi:hypothetical protein
MVYPDLRFRVLDEITNKPDVEPIWLITANVVEERAYGEGGVERRRGTKHFRGNAKVYIIGAHWGMCESVIVIGHHRASGRYVQMTIPKRHLTNLRMTLCYSPKVIELVSTECFTHENIPDKAEWERQLAVIRSWPE